MSTKIEDLPQLLQLSSGVAGLDDVLGGGIRESSCTVIAGRPGTGKSTLAQQLLRANTSAERPGVYFSGPGSPPPDALNSYVHWVHLGNQLDERDAARVLETLIRETVQHNASVVVVDTVRALTHPTVWSDIVAFLATCEITSLLISDCDPVEIASDAALSAADAVVWLRQSQDDVATTRTVQVLKARGQEPLPGPHAMRVTAEGVRVFPRWPTPPPRRARSHASGRLSVGIDQLDWLLGGGVPAGGTLLVEGPSGSGKSVMATQFVAESGHRGHPGLVLLFEERPDRFIARADAFDLELERLYRCGVVDVLSYRGRDLAADELMYEVERAVSLGRAECVVIDSTAGLDLIMHGGRGLQDCLWRLLDTLSGMGAAVWVNDTPARGSHGSLRAFADDVIELRRVDRNGRVEMRLDVLKTSHASLSTRMHAYEIGEYGVRLIRRDEERPSNGHIVGYNGVAVRRGA